MPVRAPAPYFDAGLKHVRSQHPRFTTAVVADAKLLASSRRERSSFHGRVDLTLQVVRLMWVTDAFFAQVCYRAKARLQSRGVPLLPRLLHHLAFASAQVCIGDTVLMHPGVLIGHGMIVIDGFVEIRPGVRIMSGVTIGVRGAGRGPIIGRDVTIGTGAKVLGNVRLGRGAVVGANAVVLDNVPRGATVVGAPARPVTRTPPARP